MLLKVITNLNNLKLVITLASSLIKNCGLSQI